MLELERIKTIHFIGVGGISMSALAKLMLIKGKKVSGSDLNFSETITTLTELGTNVYVGSRIDIVKNADLVVYSGAIKESDEELRFARLNKITTLSRPQFLGLVASNFDKVISISGTHGKTTTTGMISSIFLSANKLFTAHIGGEAKDIGNLIYKGEDYFITEACEYQRAFLELKSNYSAILNMEKDHPDTYNNYFEIVEAFTAFAANTKSGGKVILCADSGKLQDYTNVITFGITENANYRAENIKEWKNGFFSYQICHNGILKAKIKLSIAGYHNIYNSLCAYAIANENDILESDIKKGLENFKGVKRRFEYKGTVNGCKVILDYAHHPSEIIAAINTAKLISGNKVKVVFQPHTFSRTKELFYEFINSFSGIDSLYLIPTYKAREEEYQGLSAYNLYQAIEKENKKVYYYKNLICLAKELNMTLEKGELLLILGAGDIDTLVNLIIDY